MASRLIYRGLLDQVPLGSDLVITEFKPPQTMVGKTLLDLDLPRRFGIRVVATRRGIDGQGRLIMPAADDPIREADILVVVSPPDSVTKVLSESQSA